LGNLFENSHCFFNSVNFGDTDLTLDLNGHRAETHTHTHPTSLKHMPNKPRFYTLFKRTQG